MINFIKHTLATTIFLSCLSVAFAQTTTTPTTDGTVSPTNGTTTNGTQTNGTQTDGTQTNGTQTDGTQTDGTSTDGDQTDDQTGDDQTPTNQTSLTKPTAQSDYTVIAPDQLQWKTIDSLPVGAQYTTLQGDPTQTGPFTMRLKFPAHYEIPPVMVPTMVHGTVISGGLNIGFGDKVDKLKGTNKLPEAGFFVLQPNVHHYVWTDDVPTVLQVSGMGPWSVTYIKQTDDPRYKSGGTVQPQPTGTPGPLKTPGY